MLVVTETIELLFCLRRMKLALEYSTRHLLERLADVSDALTLLQLPFVVLSAIPVHKRSHRKGKLQLQRA